MNANIDNDDDLEDQDDDMDVGLTEDPVFSGSSSRKEKHINKEARRKIESYLEERYLKNELKDVFYDDFDE